MIDSIDQSEREKETKIQMGKLIEKLSNSGEKKKEENFSQEIETKTSHERTDKTTQAWNESRIKEKKKKKTNKIQEEKWGKTKKIKEREEIS